MSNSIWFTTMDGVNYSIDVRTERTTNSSSESLINVEAEIVVSDIETDQLFYTFTIKEFIEEDENAIKEDLYYSLILAGMTSEDADMLIANMVMVAEDMVFDDDYCLGNTLIISIKTIDSFSDINYNLQIQQRIEESINDGRPVFHPSSENAIASLEVIVIKDDENQLQDKCVICLKRFPIGSEMVILKCGHKFGKECILKWLHLNTTCPLCRDEVQ